MAYWEQVGVNRHTGGRQGAVRWYNRIMPINSRAITVPPRDERPRPSWNREGVPAARRPA